MTLLRLILLALSILLPVPAAAQHDPQAPCGRDAQGNPLPCHNVQPNMLEATCLTRADPQYCLPYHQRACQVSGFAAACRLASIGQHCYGGDPRQCQYYVALLQANTACNLNGDPRACAWLSQQPL